MNEELDGTLGVAVRELRKKCGLSQARLAKLAGVSRRHLAALEKGANVSILVVLKVARVLGATELPLGDVRLRRNAGVAPRIPEALKALGRIEALAEEARRALEGTAKPAKSRVTARRTSD